MVNPAHMWLKDDQGGDISGAVQVSGRIGSIGIFEYMNNIYISTDSDTGELTGTRKRNAINVVKAFDASSPYLFKTCCNGQRQQQAVIRWYSIDDAGRERQDYEHALEGVKINSYSPGMENAKNPTMEKIPHIEAISMRYEKKHTCLIGWDISYSDSCAVGH